MNIKNIALKNIKGIENLSVNMNLFPNKPSIFVAPNGFGKSSLAHGFECIHPRKLILKEDYYYQKNKENLPEIKIDLDDTEYIIDSTHRTFPSNWDIKVINSKLKSEAIKKNFGKFTQVSSFMGIETITIFESIPHNIKIPYSHSDFKTEFGKNGKLLINLTTILNDNFLFLIDHLLDLSDLSVIIEKLRLLIHEVNLESGTSDSIKIKFNSKIKKDSFFVDICNIFKTVLSFDEIDILFSLWQVYLISKKETFNDCYDYYRYLASKKQLDLMLSDFDTTGRNIKSKEIKNGKEKNLVVEFPRALDISNGQRDVLVFVTEIFKIYLTATKNNLLLIIDEIFDYLDAGNLTAFQYYIVKMIDHYKAIGKNIYPILLTHLDPSTFNHFYFNKKKLQVVYLKYNCLLSSKKYCLKLVEYRDLLEKSKDSLKEDIEAHFFHFHNDIFNSPEKIKNINKKWNNSKDFYDYVYNEEKKYYLNQNYEYLAILFATRIKVEEICFSLLAESDKLEFLNTHKTVNKIEFCTTKGYEIPEYFSLLGILYNDYLHWNPSKNYDSPLMIKLEHPIIRNMILKLFEQGDLK